MILALVLIGAQFWATSHGDEGPGLAAVIAQLAAAVVAVTLQTYTERHRNSTGTLALCAVPTVVIGSVVYWWWL